MEALASCELFSSLASGDLLPLAEVALSRIFEKGQVLINEAWEASPGIYLVLSGEVLIERQLDGRRLRLARRSSGEVVGELSTLDGQPPSASVVAATSVETLYLPASDFLRCLEGSAKISFQLLKVLVRRMREESSARVVTATKDVVGLVATELLNLAEREVENGVGHENVLLEVSQTELGRRFGITRESVNKAIRKLQEGSHAALVQQTKHRTCYSVDLAALRKAALR